MDNLQLSQGGSIAFASGGLATATTTSQVKTTVIVPYTIDGAFQSKAITDNMAWPVSVPATFSTPANGSFTGATGGSTRLYGLYLDSAGALTAFPGRIVNSADLAAGLDTLQYPAPIKGKVCIGVLRIAVTAGTTFIPNTTLLGAGGVTASFVNLSSIPGEPIKV